MGISSSSFKSCSFSQEQYYSAVIKGDIDTINRYFRDYIDTTDQSQDQDHYTNFNTMMYALKPFKICSNKDNRYVFTDSNRQKRLEILKIAKEQRYYITSKVINIKITEDIQYYVPEGSSMLSFAMFIHSDLLEEIIQLCLDDQNYKNIIQKYDKTEQTFLQTIAIMDRDGRILKIMQKNYPKTLKELCIREKNKTRNALTLAAFFNHQQLIQEFIKYKSEEPEILKSLDEYTDLSLTPFSQYLCDQNTRENNFKIIKNPELCNKHEGKSGSNYTISSNGIATGGDKKTQSLGHSGNKKKSGTCNSK